MHAPLRPASTSSPLRALLGAVVSSLIALHGSSGCAKHPVEQPADCSFTGGPVRTDLTLRRACSPLTIKGGIDVLENATLTLEAGLEMRFQDRDWLEISAAGSKGGKLIARGTAEAPIVLTTARPDSVPPGTWLGLWFNTGTAQGSVLSHAIVRSAGGKNKHIKPMLRQGCITLTEVAEGAVTLEDVVVEGCQQAGLVLRASRPRMRNVRVQNLETGVLLSPDLPDSITQPLSYHNVKRNSERRPL